MSYVPSESDAISSLYSLRFYGVNSQTSSLAAMNSFYASITPLKFQNSKEAILHCRQLAREYGFMIKQETSSIKHIYIYCSREGITDSLKKGKQAKRKRISNRCGCKWRIVLFNSIHEGKNQWKFKKSNNPQHVEHNHDLIPENLPVPWPPSALQRIIEYANSGLSTGDIRQLMKQEFPHLPWDERRFYNRLAEERKKIKIRETERRVNETIVLAARVASLACSNQKYTEKVQIVLKQALEDICESSNIDPNTVINISSQEDMTTISLPFSSTSDIVCNYPAGSLAVKNIPAQKKKNLLPPQLQNLFQSQSPSIMDSNSTRFSPKLDLDSTRLQGSSSTLPKHPEFEPIQQLQSQYEQHTQSNVQVPLVSQLNPNELNSFSSSQPILQENFFPHFQKQEQLYDFQPTQINPYSQDDSNQSFMSQEYHGMKFDPHLYYQIPPCEQINEHKQHILAPQTYPQIYSQPQTWEQPSFINYDFTPSLQDTLLRSCPQVFTPPPEEIIKQQLLRYNPTTEFQSDQDLNIPHSIQHMNSNIQSQNQQMFTPQLVENMNYEKAGMARQQATYVQQAIPNTGDQNILFLNPPF
ncbi:9670_t:CDS:2 [Funneliformis geosporum]|uniref:11721_t:CDS:1 n=1 Tax=Funneliformis geosporum TaxID=1117311 RepID=A0A9W4SD68_9GLOM|nr:11721_t:CDS:2 [Funneliformis geosporum]CAI2168782.1 9670_t:CDS:2 [Funneliformis geosporum]